MTDQEIKNMSLKRLVEYADEQKELGNKRIHTQKRIAEIRGWSESALRNNLKKFKNQGGQKMNTDEQNNNTNNSDFSEEEIKVLKQVAKNHENTIKVLQDYQIYKDLEKVSVDAESIRSSFTMSVETTERLKKFSQLRRLPLQDLAELAVLNMLEKYDK